MKFINISLNNYLWLDLIVQFRDLDVSIDLILNNKAYF